MGLTYENLTLVTKDKVNIQAWYIPAQNATKTVLFCHGNGGNISHRLDTVNILNELNVNCLLFDYRGYGQSDGKPSERGTYRDAMAAWKWLTEEKGLPPDDIVIFGRSLGASIAARLAKKVNPASVVLESAFTSYEKIAKKFYPYMPVHWFASFKYNTLEHVKHIKSPVLVIHSKNDETVPFEFGKQLFDAASQPKDFVEIAGCHNDGFLFSGDLYKNRWAHWLSFIQDREKTERPRLMRIS